MPKLPSYRVLLLSLFSVLLLVAVSSAQRPLPTPYSAGIQVRVSVGPERAAGQHIRLDLMTPTGISVDQRFTDDHGVADFVVDLSHPPFDFHVRANGKDVEETTSELIHFDENMDRGVTRIVYLNLKPTTEAAVKPASPVVSVAQAQVPKAARNALHDGLKAWESKDFQKAAADFEKATTLYPQYDEAFNYLGMMYAHLGQPEKSRAAFETAVKLNDKNASADRNLAGILVQEKSQDSLNRAVELCQKSLSVDPLNAVTLTILAFAELRRGNFDAAVRYAHQAHQYPHDNYALSHFVAGQALERQNDPNGAKVEYQIYLKESPQGPESARVKQALDRISAAGPQ